MSEKQEAIVSMEDKQKTSELRPNERLIKDLTEDELRKAFVNLVRLKDQYTAGLNQAQAELNGVNAELLTRENKA